MISFQCNALNVVNQRIPTTQNIVSKSKDYFTNKHIDKRSEFCHQHNATCASGPSCRTCKCNDGLIWMSFEEHGCRSRQYLDGIVNGHGV